MKDKIKIVQKGRGEARLINTPHILPGILSSLVTSTSQVGKPNQSVISKQVGKQNKAIIPEKESNEAILNTYLDNLSKILNEPNPPSANTLTTTSANATKLTDIDKFINGIDNFINNDIKNKFTPLLMNPVFINDYNLVVFRQYKIKKTKQAGGTGINTGTNIKTFLINTISFVSNQFNNLHIFKYWVKSIPSLTEQIDLERESKLDLVKQLIKVNDYQINCSKQDNDIFSLDDACIEFIFSELEKSRNINKKKFAFATLQALKPLPEHIAIQIIKNFKSNESNLNFCSAKELYKKLEKSAYNIPEKTSIPSHNNYDKIKVICEKLLNPTDENQIINLLYELQIYTGNTDWIPLYNIEKHHTNFKIKLQKFLDNYLNEYLKSMEKINITTNDDDFTLIKESIKGLVKLTNNKIEMVFKLKNDKADEYLMKFDLSGEITYKKKDEPLTVTEQEFLNILKINKVLSIDLQIYGDENADSKELTDYLKSENDVYTLKNEIISLIKKLNKIKIDVNNATTNATVIADAKTKFENLKKIIETKIEDFKNKLDVYTKTRDTLSRISPKSVLNLYVHAKHYINLYTKQLIGPPGTGTRGGKIICRENNKKLIK